MPYILYLESDCVTQAHASVLLAEHFLRAGQRRNADVMSIP
jgi:hypothetical protein